MNKTTLALAAILIAGSASAQAQGTTGKGTPGNTAPGATTNAPMTGVSPSTGTTPNTGVVGRNTGTAAAAGDHNQALTTTGANAPEPARGANSFSTGEARRRIQRNGYTNVSGLKKDDGGVWRGTASKGGASASVWLDYKGNVGQTADASSSMGTAPGVNGTTMGTTGATPGTTTSNPPGTVVTRGIDRSLGTNGTGTNPTGSNPTGSNATPR